MEKKLEEVIGAVKRIAQYVAMAEAREQAEAARERGDTEFYKRGDLNNHRDLVYKDLLGSLGID